MSNNIQIPLILVNFKTYSEATGKRALELTKIIERVNTENGVNICVAPQFTDMMMLTQSTSVKVFAQHIDPITPGSFTGHILPESVKDAGAVGTLINHSERQIKLTDIKNTVNRAREIDLISVVCVIDPTLSGTIAHNQPDFIAIEPPELIGTRIPVSRAKPEIVTQTVELVRRVNPKIMVLCGAGITTCEDIETALKLCTKGVLVSSSVTKATYPYTVLSDFAEALTR